MGLRTRLSHIRKERAARKAAKRQRRIEKLAYQLYQQRTITHRLGSASEDWARAHKIVRNPARRALDRARRTVKTIAAPVRWGLSGVADKTSWEWLELLIIPLFLAIGVFSLDNQVKQRQESIENERAKQATLDNYLEQMQGLLLDRGLRKSLEDSEVRSVARAITATAIKGLGSERNALLTSFLRESGLIQDGTSGEDTPKKSSLSLLAGLDLSEAELRNAALSNVDMSYVKLRDANLSNADLNNAKLLETNLERANLFEVILFKANLSNAKLSEADLSWAFLSEANLSGADLFKANLHNAVLYSANLSDAYLAEADLSDAIFIGANLSNASLSEADLSNATLSAANLSNTELYSANLSNAYLLESQLQKSRLCETKLPRGFKQDPDRDCGLLPFYKGHSKESG